MPTAKNGFQILNQHIKKTCISKLKILFFNVYKVKKIPKRFLFVVFFLEYIVFDLKKKTQNFGIY